jgi:hemoglobin
MEMEISKYIPGIKPDVTLPTTKMFDILGEDGIRKMINDFYDLLAQSEVAHLFPKNPIGLEKAKEHSADFFIQICGGPMYFNKNRGRPMLNRRHLPFKITPLARKIWLQCYRKVLYNLNLPDEVLASFWNYLDTFSKWMVNSKEE